MSIAEKVKEKAMFLSNLQAQEGSCVWPEVSDVSFWMDELWNESLNMSYLVGWALQDQRDISKERACMYLIFIFIQNDNSFVLECAGCHCIALPCRELRLLHPVQCS